jgi:hypothetical protein
MTPFRRAIGGKDEEADMDGKQATADAPVEEIEARVRQAFTRLALEVLT